MRNFVDCPDITIANGATTSSIVRASLVHGDADDILLMGSVIDGSKTYTIQVNDKEDGTGTWYNLNDGTTDIAPPAINKGTLFPFLSYTFRILASGAVVGAVTWKMKKAFSTC